MEQPYDLEKKRSEKLLDKGALGEDQKGLPDDMSCAGIFGIDSTKTVVIEHHKVNGPRLSPIVLHLKASHKAYKDSVSDAN